MLKQRILTAIILIPLFVLFLLKSTPTLFIILTGLFVLLGAWEWTSLMEIKKLSTRLIYLFMMTVFLIGSVFLPITSILTAAAIWWMSTILLVVGYPRGAEFWGRGLLVRGLMGFLVLIPCWRAIIFIETNNANGPFLLLFLFVLIWGADSAAYFAGRKWGKNKLAPLVSPGKTWEGFMGALGMTLIIVLLLLMSLHTPYLSWPGVILISFVTVIFSVIGDLFESMLKRKAGIKDSGRIFPGHGGVLDRIDSLTAAAPIFALCSLLLAKIHWI